MLVVVDEDAGVAAGHGALVGLDYDGGAVVVCCRVGDCFARDETWSGREVHMWRAEVVNGAASGEGEERWGRERERGQGLLECGALLLENGTRGMHYGL